MLRVGAPTPCGSCVKCKGCTDPPSPQVGRRKELSEKNLRTVDLYHRYQGTLGNFEIDDLTAENFALIHRIYSSFKQQTSTMAACIPQLLANG